MGAVHGVGAPVGNPGQIQALAFAVVQKPVFVRVDQAAEVAYVPRRLIAERVVAGIARGASIDRWRAFDFVRSHVAQETAGVASGAQFVTIARALAVSDDPAGALRDIGDGQRRTRHVVEKGLLDTWHRRDGGRGGIGSRAAHLYRARVDGRERELIASTAHELLLTTAELDRRSLTM